MKVFVISRGIPSEKYPLYGIFEYDQAKALTKCGVDVSMLVIDFRSIRYKRKYGLFSYVKDDVKVFELSLPLGIYRRALPLLQMLLMLLYKKAVRKVGTPDIIHAHFYSIAAIASIIKKKKNIPFFITEHSSKLNKDKSLISELDKALTAKAYSHADTVIAVSKALSINLKNNFDIDNVVVHDIVDVDNYHYVKNNNNQHFNFISVGNLIHLKGFDLLINAFNKAFANDNNVFLNIVGDGIERDYLQSLINQYDINDRVRLLGQKSRAELCNIIRESDAFVLASRSETFGVVYVEAMACGLPVIATLCGGPEDFVNDDNGVLIPVDDIDALANAMIDMCSNIDKYDGKSISKECYDKFSPKSIANEIIRYYDKVLN